MMKDTSDLKEVVRKTDEGGTLMTKTKQSLTDLHKLAHELGVAKIVFTSYNALYSGEYLQPSSSNSGLAKDWGLTKNMHGRITTQTLKLEKAVILVDVKYIWASHVPHILAHEIGHHCFYLAYGSCQGYGYASVCLCDQKPPARLLRACVNSGLFNYEDTSSVEEIVAETFAHYLEGKLTFNRVLDAEIAEVLQRMPAKARPASNKLRRCPQNGRNGESAGSIQNSPNITSPQDEFTRNSLIHKCIQREEEENVSTRSDSD